jgi:hypothetical protein
MIKCFWVTSLLFFLIVFSACKENKDSITTSNERVKNSDNTSIDSTQNQKEEIIQDGLILEFDASKSNSLIFEDRKWVDISGNDYIANYKGSPKYEEDNNGALVFNGYSDFLTGPQSNNFKFGRGDFTISYWVYINEFSGAGMPTVIDMRTTMDGAAYSDFIYKNKFKMWWNRKSCHNGKTTLESNKWYNICVTRLNSIISVYINNSLDGSFVDKTNFNQGSFRIARNFNSSNTNFLNGKISHILIYKGKALSRSEVAKNYTITKNLFGY